MNALQQQIATYIYNQAPSYGVNPNTALGIAWSEGLNRSNPLATNSDGSIGGVPNTAVGPFQFGTAGLGGQLGINASTPWQNQVDAALKYMGSNGTGPWNSVGDQGGIGAINGIGANVASQFGIGGAATDSGMSLSQMPASEVAVQGSADSVAQSSGFIGTALNSLGFGGGALGALGLGGSAPMGSSSLPSMASGQPGTGINPVGQDQSTGVPVNITDPNAIASKAGESVKAGTEALTSGLAKDTASLTTSGTGWLQYAGNLVYDLIPRGGVGVAAIVLILMGLWLMGKQAEVRTA
jgi:hypothetical protein